jgi:hypothetical protein
MLKATGLRFRLGLGAGFPRDADRVPLWET